MTNEKKMWLIVQNILDTHGDQIDGIGIHDSSDFHSETDGFKIYHHDGYCWELEKEFICDPSEVDEFGGVEDDGFNYVFAEPWDDFKETGIEKAIEILGTYGQPIEPENE